MHRCDIPKLRSFLVVWGFLFLLSACADTNQADVQNTTRPNIQTPPPPAAIQPTSIQKPAASDSLANTPERQQPRMRVKTYVFETPDSRIELPKELKEISGLSFLDDKHLAVIQDEKGKIFSIKISDGKIVDDKRFAKDGDFEGIEIVNETIYVLRSDGDVYKVEDWPTSKTDAKKYETSLSTKYDTEGLAYDAALHRLLIACKEFAGPGLKEKRAIYEFDLKKNKLNDLPVLIIDLKEIESLTPDHPLNRAIRNLTAPLLDLSGFKPAALAIHPITGQIFVISSVRKILLAYNPDGTLEDLWVLSEDLFRQPEGMAFLPNGDLFIANEGGNGRATLLRFNYQ